MLFAKLLPREGNFFEMFNQHADRIVEAARAFSQLVANYSDPHLRDKYNQDVDNAERAADRVTHEVNKAIHKTFITPIDREQIHTLINTMDDVADLIQDSAETMSLYDIREMTEEITRLTDLSVKSVERMRDAVSSMRVSTTVRAVMSVGALTTSVNAFIMSLMAAPSPAVPPLKTSCSWRRRSARTMSADCVEPAAADWRVSSSLWLRRIVCTSTPWPI